MAYWLTNSTLSCLFLVVISVLMGWSSSTVSAEQELQVVEQRFVNQAPVQPDYEHRLVVKFRDNIDAIAKAGFVTTSSLDANQFVFQLVVEDAVRFEQLLRLPANRLEEMESRAAVRSGRPQPKLSAMMVVNAPQDSLQAIANRLHESEFVEWVQFEMLTPPPPVFIPDFDIAPTTPSYYSLQGFLGANPGMNVEAFWALGNHRGDGINVADCEYWFNGSHEDICGVVPEAGQTPNPQVIVNGWDEHGTASLGEVVGGDNGYGVTGIASEAQAFFFPEWTIEEGSRRTTAIANAVATMGPGDVVLLEMQTNSPGGLGPAELNLSVWNVVRNATDAGIIVVAAAGNGNANLDLNAEYQARGDSGAIIVGAGSADIDHDKLSFSTFGSRVDIQGWGGLVFSSGYGWYSEIGGDKNQRYTDQFSGTSSASAMIAGACVAAQSFAVAEIGRRLTPSEMRDSLKETGWPQGSGGNIGPFPNMVAMAEKILELGQQFLLGDVNQDGAVDLLDVAPFVELIGSGGYQFEADINQDGQVDLLDVEPFVDLLSG